MQPRTCEFWDAESNFCALHRPSATQTNDSNTLNALGWIPVTERLPEKDGMYLVSIIPQSIMERRVDTDFYSHFGIWDIFGKFVTAWMPLPEPYKEATDAQLD